MAIPYRAEKTITLGFGDDAKIFTLGYDPGTVADLEQRLKLSVPEIATLLEENRVGFNFLIQAITAGLQRHHNGFTVGRVSQIFDPSLAGEYALAVIFCFGVACGGDPDDLQRRIDKGSAGDAPSGEAAPEGASEIGPDGPPSSGMQPKSESPQTISGG